MQAASSVQTSNSPSASAPAKGGELHDAGDVSRAVHEADHATIALQTALGEMCHIQVLV